MKKFILLSLGALLLSCTQVWAGVKLTSTQGWFESGFVTWDLLEGAKTYNVYVKSSEGSAEYQQLDDALVRDYGTYGRADALGLPAGTYSFKVVPVGSDNNEDSAQATESPVFTVKAHDRGGFAHFNRTAGVGAYNNDGTLKANARVIYVHAGNAKTVTCDVATKSDGTTATYTGMQNIIYGYQKGYETRPLAIRIIGTLRDTDMDELLSSSEGLQIKGKNAASELNITIEGVGNDATIWGFGILIRNAASVELRNFANMLCMDDCVSIDTDNSNIWVHNLDLFYGNTGGDSDQAKGDGTIDMKGDSKYITVSYNHFWDCGKSSLCGMKSETGPNWITYHHNWFDHSDSRHPRIRTMSVHVYNNYFDGNAKYGVGVTTGGNVYVENNYFRSCNRPMMISLQGTDTKMGTDYDDAPTFSGEQGGMIKAFGNIMQGKYTYAPYSADNSTEFDAYEVTARDEQVPATVKAKEGGYTYSNFDTDATLMYSGYTLDEAAEVPSILSGTYGAGRSGQGDFRWTFNNDTDDTDYGVITELKTALQQYKTTWVGFFGNPINGESGDQGSESEGEGENEDSEGEGSDPGSTPTYGSDSLVCVFTGRQPSNTDFFTFTGCNYSNSKGSAVVDGVTYSECLKIESATSVSFTTTRKATLKVVFGSSETVSLKVDGVKTTEQSAQGSNVLLMDIEPGTHTLTKADSRNVFYIGVFLESTTGIDTIHATPSAETSDAIYNLRGQKVNNIERGQIYIVGDSKRIVR